MTAAGAVVHGVIIHQSGFAVDPVLWFYYFGKFHIRCYLLKKTKHVLYQSEHNGYSAYEPKGHPVVYRKKTYARSNGQQYEY
jgi:hypothetical protein